jgi:nucleoid DNA-binding protein
MATEITDEKELTENDVREALRMMIQQIKESQERMKIIDEQIARNRAEREQIKVETRESLARIDKIIARL